jgi:PST family polysaccharide transporter
MMTAVTSKSPGVAASAISGIRWSYFGGIGSSLCSLAIGIVLARILGPKPYGQVIIASTIYGFLNLFVDGGFSQALIQKRHLDPQKVRKTFTCQVGMGFMTTGIVCFLAPWIARQFHDPSATRVIQTMALIIAIQSAGLVSAALLRRKMHFKVIQCAGIASYLVGYVALGIPLALLGAGVWSLVTACLAQCLLNSTLLYAAVRHSLAPSFGLPDRITSRFGGTIVANNLVNWGHSNLDNLAAAQLGPIGLGLYGRACNFAYQPANAVVTGLQSVLISSVAKLQDRKRLIGDLTLCILAIIFGVLGSVYAVLALTPETIILGLFGDKWIGVVPLLLPLAMAMPFYAAHCVLGPILCGLGRPELEFWPQAISCSVAALAFFAAAQFSLVAVAWALLGVMLFRFGMIAIFAFRLLQLTWGKVLRVVAMRIGFSVAFGGLAWSLDETLRVPFHFAAAPRLIALLVFCAVSLGSSIWCAGDLVFGSDAIRFLLNYASHLPAPYVRQLRMQAHQCGKTTMACLEIGHIGPTGVIV